MIDASPEQPLLQEKEAIVSDHEIQSTNSRKRKLQDFQETVNEIASMDGISNFISEYGDDTFAGAEGRRHMKQKNNIRLRNRKIEAKQVIDNDEMTFMSLGDP